MKLERLDHFGLEVGDLARAEEFYTRVLGLAVVARLGDQVLLDCGVFRGPKALRLLQQALEQQGLSLG